MNACTISIASAHFTASNVYAFANVQKRKEKNQTETETGKIKKFFQKKKLFFVVSLQSDHIPQL